MRDQDIKNSIKSLLIALYLEYNMNETDGKRQIISDIVELVNEVVIKSVSTSEQEDELLYHLKEKVDELIGESEDGSNQI